MLFFRYGEIVNINLVRDRKSGKSKGFCFLAYEDQRSTVLAVDNLNGIKVCTTLAMYCRNIPNLYRVPSRKFILGGSFKYVWEWPTLSGKILLQRIAQCLQQKCEI